MSNHIKIVSEQEFNNLREKFGANALYYDFGYTALMSNGPDGIVRYLKDTEAIGALKNYADRDAVVEQELDRVKLKLKLVELALKV